MATDIIRKEKKKRKETDERTRGGNVSLPCPSLLCARLVSSVGPLPKDRNEREREKKKKKEEEEGKNKRREKQPKEKFLKKKRENGKR